MRREGGGREEEAPGERTGEKSKTQGNLRGKDKKKQIRNGGWRQEETKRKG